MDVEANIKKIYYTDSAVLKKYRSNYFYPPYVGDLGGILNVGDTVVRYVDASNKNTCSKDTGMFMKGVVTYIHEENRFFTVRFPTKNPKVFINESFPMHISVVDVQHEYKRKGVPALYEKIGLLPTDTQIAIFGERKTEEMNMDVLKASLKKKDASKFVKPEVNK